jgi:SAM-dependent methyltransferase
MILPTEAGPLRVNDGWELIRARDQEAVPPLPPCGRLQHVSDKNVAIPSFQGLLMTTDYNPIARQYQRSKLQPWRTYIECFTLFELIGDVHGKAVLDLACGEGYYTRRLAHGGAARVVGADLSQRMIDLARDQEQSDPHGIDYRVGDARNLDLGEDFDVVVAGYLLNYAATREELLAMCRTIVRHLRPGGRFVTVNNNPAQPRAAFSLGRKYGFLKSAEEEPRDGTAITWTFFLEEGPFAITNYQLSVGTHEEVLREAGFRDIRWHEPRLMPEGAAAEGEAFWEDFLSSPPIIFIECAR